MQLNLQILVGWLTLIIGAAFPAATQADFIGGTVWASAGMDETSPDDPSNTASGLSPSVTADFELFEEGFYLHSQSAASITTGEGVSIHVSSQTLVDGDFDVTGARANASASWTERFFFSPLDLDVSSAQRIVRGNATLQVDGSISTGGTAVGEIAIGIVSDGHGISFGYVNSVSEELTFEFNLFLVPGPLGVYTGKVSLAVDAFSRAIFIPDVSVVDFSNTVTFKNVYITDLDGNPLPGTLTSETGVNYNPVPQAVPEPGSLTLVGLGALGMAIGFLRRRQQQASCSSGCSR